MPISASSIINSEVRGYTGSIGYVGSRGTSDYTVSNTAPVSARVGDRWLDSNSGIEYTYLNDGDGNVWVELGSISATAAVNGLLASNLSFGTNSSTTIAFNSQIASDLIPSANETYSLGSATNRWANVYLAANTINLGNVALSASNGQLVLPSNVKIGNAFIDGTSGGTVNTSTAATGSVPKISTITYPGNDTAADPAGGQTITLTGSGFQAGASIVLDGVAVGVVSVVNTTTITFTAPAKSAGSYIIYVINTDGGTAIAIPGIQYSGIPTWSTTAGNIGGYVETTTFNNTLTATGDAPITYSLQSGTLPPGATLNANGTVTGTSQLTASPTTYTFTVRASDAQNQDTDRSFSITVNPDTVTWSSPAAATEYSLENGVTISNVTLSASSAAGSSITYTANALPTGLSVSGATISGTPTGYEENTTIGTLLTANATATTRTATRSISWVVQVGDTYFNLSSALLQADNKTFITDSSTNNFTSVTYNGAKPNRLSPHWPGGWSVLLDGSSNYITFNAFTGVGAWTVEFWLYMLVTPGAAVPIASQGQSDSTGNFIMWMTNTRTLMLYSNGAICQTTASVPLNQWSHIAYVSNASNNVTIYIDGVSRATGTYSGKTFNSTPFQINRGYGGVLNGTNYYMSNFRMVKGTAVYTANFTPSTTALSSIAGTEALLFRNHDLKDYSANNYTLTVSGSAPLRAFSPFNNTPYNITPNSYSVYFDGTGDRISVPYDSSFAFGTGDFTIEFWMYPLAQPSQAGIYIHSPNAGAWGPIWLVYESGIMRLYATTANNTWDIANQAALSGTIPMYTWTHFAMTRSSGVWRSFVNGSQYWTITNAGSLYVLNTAINIGLFGDDTRPYTGSLSNLRVLKGTAAYTANFTPATSALTAVANTSLLTCQSTTIRDNSANNFTLNTLGEPQPVTGNPFGETVAAISNYTWSANSYGASTFFDTTGYIVTTTTSAAMAPGTGDFTCEAWIYHNGSDIAGIVEARPGGNWVMFVQSNGLYLYHSVAGQTGFGTIPVNQWSHVALSRSGGIIYYFINGRQVGTWSNANNMTGGTSCYIGSNLGGGGTGYAPNAYMSDIRLVIGTALYTKSFLPPTAPLTAIANTTLLILQADIGHNNNLYVDHSGHNHLITRNGNTTQGSLSPLIPSGWSLYFDGTGDSLSYTGVALTGDFTVECWIYKTVRNASGYTVVLNNNSAPNRGGTQFTYDNTTDGSIGLYLQNTSVISPSGTAVLANQWNHLAWTRSGSTCRAFVNGLLQGSGTYSGTTGILDLVSSYQLSGGYGITGYLNNLRIVDGTALYTANFTPSTTTLSSIAGTRLLLARGPSLSDDGPNNFAITRYGDVTTTPFSPFKPHSITPKSYSVYFDGTGDYLTAPSNSAFALSGDFTVECWVYMTTVQTCVFTGNIKNTGEGDWAFFYNSSFGLRFITDNSATVCTGTVTLNANTWYHVAVARSGTSLRIFSNGTLLSTTTNSSTNPSTGPLQIGRANDGQLSLIGYISNLRILKGTAQYTANFTPSTTSLSTVANTSLLTCQSSSVVDNSSNAFTITVNGDARPRSFNPFGDTVTAGVTYAPATHGGSAYFDGTGDYLTIPSNPSLSLGGGSFTVECWVYISGAQTQNFGHSIVGTYPGSGNGWNLTINRSSTALGIQWVNGSPSALLLSYGTYIPNNTWTHIAIVRSSTATNGISAYVNGALVATGTDSTNDSVLQTLYIGAQGPSSCYFPGYISNLRILKGTALYTSAFVPALTAPAAVNNTSLLLNFTNGGIVDATGRTVLETVGTARVINNITKYGTGSIYIPNNDTSSARYRTFDNSLTFGTGSWTVEFWTYIITASPNGWLIFASTDPYSSDGASIGWGVGYNVDSTDSKFQSTINNNGSLVGIESTNTYSYNTWYHVALTYDRTTLRQFVNGSLQGSSAGSYNITTANLHLFVGWAPISGVRISAYFDDVRITRGAARYTANFTPPALHQTK